MNVKCNVTIDKSVQDSKLSIRVFALLLYVDALCLVNLFINTIIFRQYELTDIIAILLLVVFVLSTAFIVTRLVVPKLLLKESLSVAVMLLALLSHHELNV